MEFLNSLRFNLFPTPPPDLPHYNFKNLVLMFFIFAFAGWIWEVIYTAITEKVIAKRGMLHGPWLPIYGVGGVLILLSLTRFQANPPLVFVLAVMLCSTVEYSTAIAIERIFNCRWWDYGDKFMNIRGRICLGGMLLFGLSGTIAVCRVGPMLNENIGRLPRTQHIGIIAVLAIAFIVDIIISLLFPNRGKGITYEIQNKHKPKDK